VSTSSPSAGPANSTRLQSLLEALAAYGDARVKLLQELQLEVSNRDPLAELSEHVMLALLGGELAPSRVQKDYDLTTAAQQRVQVRYLANPAGTRWVNEHHVRSAAGFELYALVLYEAFSTVAVLVFPSSLGTINEALGKRHPDQDMSLQLTRRNYLAIRDDPDRFRALGMQVWLQPFVGEA
jgi:hypothetical protein